MLDSYSHRVLRNGKRYNTDSGRTMNENGIVEDNRAGKSSENTDEEVPVFGLLTQETINESSVQKGI